MDRDVRLTGFNGETVFRYANYDTPFWSRNNRDDGRWHVVGDGATQYLTTDPDGAWAELARYENLRSDVELALVRMPIWAITLAQQNLVDYTTFARAEEAGFPPDALIDDDYLRCQEEGQRLRAAGYAGVVAPSAALPGVLNVTVFGRRMISTWGAPSRLASSIPACVVAVGGPPAGLAANVRFKGDVHTGYAAYIEELAEERRIAGFEARGEDTDDAPVRRQKPPGDDELGTPQR